MRLPLLLSCLLCLASPALAETYKLDAEHTSATFTYSHFGLTHPTGKIMGASGALSFDPDHPADSKVAVTLDMTTLSTGLSLFDKQLQGPDYFDAAQFPTAAFTSTAVTVTGPDSADVSGDLTLHGITRPVTLAVTFTRKAFNPALVKTGIGFTANTHISRSAFGVSRYEPFIGDDIEIHIEAEAYP